MTNSGSPVFAIPFASQPRSLRLLLLLLILLTSGLWLSSRAVLSANFLPHWYCFAGNARVLWTTVIADLLIGLCYVVISATLVFIVRRGTRPAVPGLFLGLRIVHRELWYHVFLRNSHGVEAGLLAFGGGQNYHRRGLGWRGPEYCSSPRATSLHSFLRRGNWGRGAATKNSARCLTLLPLPC
jgi:hypothetical protein